jgi:hypothetical protein
LIFGQSALQTDRPAFYGESAMFSPLVMSVAIFLGGAEAPSQAASGAAPPIAAASDAVAKAAATPDDDTVVCKRIETTGSRFASTICHTKRGWADEERAARDFVDSNTRLSHNKTPG